MARPGAPDPGDALSGACDLVAGCSAAKAAGGAAKDAAGDAASGAADSFMERLIEGTLNGLVEVIGHVTLAMFGIPSPNVGEVAGGSVEPSATLAHAYGGLSWLIIALTMLSLLVALGRMFWTMEAAESKVIIRMMINLIASTTIILGMVVLALEFSDRASPWLMTRISGYDENEINSGAKLTEALMGLNMAGKAGEVVLFADLALIGLILLVLAFFGVLATILFLIVRNPLLVAMCAFLPLFAATSGTRAGQERFNKALAFIVAFVLYKPVAAILLGIGLRMLKPLDAEKQPLMTFMSGAVLVALTGIALPAMIKLFAGEASVGSSNAFSGGAVVAAGGAAVMSSAMLAGAFASGGASAGGAGASGGGAAGGGAAGAGAAPPPSPTPSPGGSGGGGGGGQPPPPGPGGGGGGSGGGPAQGSGGTGASGDGGAPGVGSSQDGGDESGGDGAGASGDGGAPGVGSSGEGGSSGESGASGGASDPGSSGGAGETGAAGGSGMGQGGAEGAGGSAGSSGADGEGRSGADGAQGRDGMHGQEGQQGLTGSTPAGGGAGGGSGSGGATGASSGGGHHRTAEGAQLVGSRALGKAALAAGTGGQQAAKGATGAANDMSQGG